METISVSWNSSSFINILNKHSLLSKRHKQIFFLPQRHGFSPINCSTRDSSSINTNDNDDAKAAGAAAPQSQPRQPSAVEISFRRRSRRQARRQGENNENNKMKAKVRESPPKKWEDMSLSEKAIELYVGEKGALYWLNKFAYASIFIMIGGWIVFRFVGPVLNLYQLDAPLLSPSDVLK